MTLHINTPEVKEIVQKAFPEYNGKRFKVAPFTGKMSLTSYWNGGSRDYWALINANTNKAFFVPENGTPWTTKAFEIGRLPVNIFLVCYHRGPYEDMTVYVNPDNLNRLALPPVSELTRNEKIVLIATRSLKSSYAGIKDYRFREAKRSTNISLEDWITAKISCQNKGFLNKAGAITDAGRNAIGNMNFYSLDS